MEQEDRGKEINKMKRKGQQRKNSRSCLSMRGTCNNRKEETATQSGERKHCCCCSESDSAQVCLRPVSELVRLVKGSKLKTCHRLTKKKEMVPEPSEILLGQQKDAVQTPRAKPCLFYRTKDQEPWWWRSSAGA